MGPSARLFVAEAVSPRICGGGIVQGLIGRMEFDRSITAFAGIVG
jgi:hypothetical protein